MELPESWTAVEGETRTALEDQLRTEVAAGHPLFGKPVTAIALCGRCDDVLYAVGEEPAWFAQVHLAWRRTPDDPPWPRTKRLSSHEVEAHLGHH